MEVSLVDRQPVRIVHLRTVGPYGPPVARFWKDRVGPWIARRGLREREMFAIFLDDPEVTPAERCRCDIGVAVDDAFSPIDDERIMTIPGGRYAATRFFGTPEHMHEPWQYLLGRWLPASGFQLDGRPTFEYYAPDMRLDEATGAFECDVTIPIKPS